MANNGSREYGALHSQVREVLADRAGGSLAKLAQEAIETYWRIGRCLSSHEELVADRSRFHHEMLRHLSADLTKEFGEGFSEPNLRAMMAFYRNAKNALNAERLSWGDYLRLCRYEAGQAVSAEPAVAG